MALSAILLLPVGLAIFYEDGSFVEFAITSFTAFFVGLGFVQYGKFDEKENITIENKKETIPSLIGIVLGILIQYFI